MFPRVIERAKEQNIYETHSVELSQELSAEQTFQILITEPSNALLSHSPLTSEAPVKL